jgi:anti-sigma regulatory factor (Ser/Thr protein kinase)
VPATLPERESAAVYTLESTGKSVPEARRLACEFASDRMARAQSEQLGLAVTELVSNAVRHSRSSEDIRLILTAKDGYMCVRVIDGGDGLAPMPGAMSTEPGAGFGLFLVEQLTRRWGMTREDGKTRVWFEIDYAEGAPGTRVSDAPCDPL